MICRLIEVRRLIAASALVAASACAHKPCANRGTTLLVRSSPGRLYLCHKGQEELSFSVALGRGGTGKTKRGDNRTPAGTYTIRPVEDSESGFYRFIGINYPTRAQIKLGYTGSRVGIHGPSRGMKWLGYFSTLVNWTRGCIAVGADGELDEIEQWIRKRGTKSITIH